MRTTPETGGENEQRVWDLMRTIDFCMFTTLSGRIMRARPMSSIVHADERAIYLLSDRNGGKDEEIETHPDVCLAYSNGSSQFVSLSGTAVISTDRALIERLWNPGAQAFWPNGPRDPDVYAIVVRPSKAEYWDGNSGLVAAAKMVWSMATGSPPNLGDNKKINL
ncbi:MAG: pyridoxamine 5'-phosphate oxidase family protein [Beijerinckiaceae bacterium]